MLFSRSRIPLFVEKNIAVGRAVLADLHPEKLILITIPLRSVSAVRLRLKIHTVAVAF